jgi:hypothetical protein
MYQRVSEDGYRVNPPKKSNGLFAACSVLALAWTGAVGAGAYALNGADGLLKLSNIELASLVALAMGPGATIFFAGLFSRETARARARSEQAVQLAESVSESAAAYGGVEASEALRGEIVALDTVIRKASQRMEHYRAALREDGGAFAMSVKTDIETLRSLRAEFGAESQALSEAVSGNVALIREASQHMTTQMNAFGEAFAQIGARSAEFAAAAEAGQNSAEIFDRAVNNALQGLAHATSMNEGARQSVVESAAIAREAAQALTDTTTRALAQARKAAGEIRAVAPPPANPAQKLAETLTGRHEPENLDASTPVRLSNMLDMFRLKPPAPKAAPVVIANDTVEEPESLSEIVGFAGIQIEKALSLQDLALIARAGRGDSEARRDATRDAAGAQVQRLSAYLRRNVSVRRTAEMLRREPARAIAANGDTRASLAQTRAYLLIDAALG